VLILNKKECNILKHIIFLSTIVYKLLSYQPLEKLYILLLNEDRAISGVNEKIKDIVTMIKAGEKNVI